MRFSCADNVEGKDVCLGQAKCGKRLEVCTSSNWKRQEHAGGLWVDGRGTTGSGVAQEGFCFPLNCERQNCMQCVGINYIEPINKQNN